MAENKRVTNLWANFPITPTPQSRRFWRRFPDPKPPPKLQVDLFLPFYISDTTRHEHAEAAAPYAPLDGRLHRVPPRLFGATKRSTVEPMVSISI